MWQPRFVRSTSLQTTYVQCCLKSHSQLPLFTQWRKAHFLLHAGCFCFFVFSLFLMCGLFDTLCLDLQQQMVRCLWNGGAQCQLELKVVFPQWVAKRHMLSNCWCYFSDCCLSFYSFSFLHRITARQRKWNLIDTIPTQEKWSVVGRISGYIVNNTW